MESASAMRWMVAPALVGSTLASCGSKDGDDAQPGAGDAGGAESFRRQLKDQAFGFGRKGDHEGAIAAYTVLIRLDPDDAVTWANRGGTKSASGDHKGALADLNRAIAIDPGLALAYHNRGNARRKLGDDEGAKADWAKAKELIDAKSK